MVAFELANVGGSAPLFVRSITAWLTPPAGVTAASYDQRVALAWLAPASGSALLGVLPNSTTQALWAAPAGGGNVTLSVPNVR